MNVRNFCFLLLFFYFTERIRKRKRFSRRRNRSTPHTSGRNWAVRVWNYWTVSIPTLKTTSVPVLFTRALNKSVASFVSNRIVKLRWVIKNKWNLLHLFTTCNLTHICLFASLSLRCTVLRFVPVRIQWRNRYAIYSVNSFECERKVRIKKKRCSVYVFVVTNWNGDTYDGL